MAHAITYPYSDNDVKKLDALSSDKRHATLKTHFLKFANESKPGERDYLPLFARGGLRDSAEFRDVVTKLAVEYVDMMILKFLFYKKAANNPHEQVNNARFQGQIRKELIAWNTHAIRQLSKPKFKNELLSYHQTYWNSSADGEAEMVPPNVEGLARTVLGSTIRRGGEMFADTDLKAVPLGTTSLDAAEQYVINTTDSKSNDHRSEAQKLICAKNIIDSHLEMLEQMSQTTAR